MLFNNDLRAIEKALDGYALRFQAEAHNVANVNTPGYKRQEVNFEDSLKQAIETSQEPINPDNPASGPLPDASALLANWSPTITVDPMAQRIDGNGVSMEQEMGDLARTVMKYETETEWVASEYRDLKFVIDAK